MNMCQIKLVVLLIVCSALESLGCLIGSEKESLSKLRAVQVPICIILNDRSLYSAQVAFDEFSRITLQGSFSEVSTPKACDSNPTWFPLGCPDQPEGTYGDGLGRGAPTNLYASVQGVASSYRKRYANMDDKGEVLGVFPILTLVVSVSNGNVEEVYWDDNCYFNQDGSVGSSGDSMSCVPNAYDLQSNIGNASFIDFLNPSNSQVSNAGYDTMISPLDACRTNMQNDDSTDSLPTGFCDLGIYVAWTGTSADGQRLDSAGRRFRRPRMFGMEAQYPTMLNFQGNS